MVLPHSSIHLHVNDQLIILYDHICMKRLRQVYQVLKNVKILRHPWPADLGMLHAVAQFNGNHFQIR